MKILLPTDIPLSELYRGFGFGPAVPVSPLGVDVEACAVASWAMAEHYTGRYGNNNVPVISSRDKAWAKPPAEAFAAALSDLLESPDKGRKLGRQARAIAVERYDLNLHVSRIVDLYSEVISRRRSDGEDAR